ARGAETGCLIQRCRVRSDDARWVMGGFANPFAWSMIIHAHRGRLERARATLRPLVEETASAEKAWWAAILLSVLGFVEFAAGDHLAADQALERMHELFAEIGIRDGLLDRTEPFHVELLAELGEVERAGETLDRLERRGRTFPRVWISVALPRARAIVAAAEGDVPRALTALNALDRNAATRLPFELAWSRLVEGRLHRRSKQRRAAASALSDAFEIFEPLRASTLPH